MQIALVTAQQMYRGSPKDLALDVAFLTDKSVLLGIVDRIEDDQLIMVVERAWLRDRYPEFYNQQLMVEREQFLQSHTLMQKRIERWIARRNGEVDLRIFLEDELKLFQEKKDSIQLENYRFMYLSIPKNQIRKLVQQPNWQTQVAAVSWEKNLTDVAVRTANQLRRELEQKKISWETIQPDFRAEIPARAQSDREWAFRQAIVEHAFTQPLEFQGVSGALIRRGGSLQLTKLLEMTLGSNLGGQSIQQLGEELGLPEFSRNKAIAREPQKVEQRWEEQIAIAEREGRLGFSVIQLNQNLALNRVDVGVFFVAKDDVGKWQVLKQFLGSARAEEQRDADLAALRADPQIERIVDVFNRLGLASQTKLNLALKHGLATQSAMQEGMNQFAEFITQNTKGLKGPRLETGGQ